MNIEKISIKYMQLCDLDDVCRLEAAAYGEHHWSRDGFVNELNNVLFPTFGNPTIPSFMYIFLLKTCWFIVLTTSIYYTTKKLKSKLLNIEKASNSLKKKRKTLPFGLLMKN